MTAITGLSNPGEIAVDTASWMVIQAGGFSYAVASERIDVVFRTQEASVTQLIKPQARIEVHQGKPWFVQSLENLALLQEFGHADKSTLPQWTIGLRHPAGLAIHADSIEGPFKGLVTAQSLQTSQGDWPLLEWRS